MADKLTQQIVEALSKAAAEPCGLPLFILKSDAGLFASTAKAAAQKCLNDRLLHLVRTENRGKSPRELYAPTEAGWEFLLAAVNPKHVLEDFVRVLEERQGEVFNHDIRCTPGFCWTLKRRCRSVSRPGSANA